MTDTWDIADEIHDERERQDRKWGVDSITQRSAESGYRVLGEEVGEVAKAINERDREQCRKELVQVAAVAVAMIQALDAGSPLVHERASYHAVLGPPAP